MEEHGKGRATKWIWLGDGEHFDIPYRSLLPLGLDNVFVAGRCIAATHDAQASIRVTAQCFATGEAAGTAAALCLAEGVSGDQLSVKLLQSTLSSFGALLN